MPTRVLDIPFQSVLMEAGIMHFTHAGPWQMALISFTER
jgi:hypothetical protein